MNVDQKIFTEIQSIVQKVINDEKIILKLDSKASEIEGWDSLAHIRILVSIEKLYSIKFNLSEMQNMKDVSEFVRLIQQKIDKK